MYSDSYALNDRKVFVSPEITETSKVQLLHFPTEKLTYNEAFEFFLIRNEARGNLAAKVHTNYMKFIFNETNLQLH